MKTKEFIKAIEKILIEFGAEEILEKGKIDTDTDTLTFIVTWLPHVVLANLEQFLKDKGYIYYIDGTIYIPKRNFFMWRKGNPILALEVVIYKPTN